MKVAVGCDHGGIVLKEKIIETLNKLGAEVVDFGTNSSESVDYPVFAEKVAHAVADKVCDLGVLLCGTGIGMSIVANKVKGIRAAVLSDVFSAKATRQHNDSNILCLGGRVVTPEDAAKLLTIWYTAEFEGGRHQKRVDMISDIENRNL